MPHKVFIELTEKDMDTNLKTQNTYSYYFLFLQNCYRANEK